MIFLLKHLLEETRNGFTLLAGRAKGFGGKIKSALIFKSFLISAVSLTRPTFFGFEVFMQNILSIQNNPQNYPLTAVFPEQKQPLVLIAESDAAQRTELKTLLDLYGVRVLEAADGEEVIDLTVRECPNLILINAELPRLDGYEAARLIRNIKSFDRMPIIFLSAETDRVFRKRAFAVGADSFHIAPLDIERLDPILENFLFRAINTAKI